MSDSPQGETPPAVETHTETNTETNPETESRPPPPNRVPTAEQPRVCWICYADSTEDDEHSAHTWRTPCPCALTAHEGCLLDWVADLENPKNRKGTKSDKIQCPQCKSEIKIERPKSIVVDSMRRLDRVAAKLTFPGVVFTFAGTLWAGAFYHGFQSIYWVFGPEDAERILEHAAQHRGVMQVGLPLIPLNLIMARTRYSDFFLPATTIFLLSTQMYDKFELDLTIWPPTASTTFACLPLIRNTYCFLWERSFGTLEKKWMAEIQPRAGQDDSEDGHANDADVIVGDGPVDMDDLQDGDVVLDFEVNIGLGGDEEEDDFPIQQPPQAPVPEAAAPPPPPIANPNVMPNLMPETDAPNPAAPPPQQPNAAPPPPNPPAAAAAQQQAQAGALAQNANALVLESTSIASTVLGALVFPAISSLMGHALSLSLPTTWTTPPPTPLSITSPFTSETLSHIWNVITGRVGEKTASGLTRLPLLQTRWGRTVVGGCIFVVVKDFLQLYWRYRLARSHRERRVMDWDRGSGSWRLPTR